MEKGKTAKKHGNDGSLLNGYSKDGPNSGMNWKEWKLKRKEENKKWKQDKILKKEEKLKTAQNNESNKNNSFEKSQIHRDYTISIAVPGSILDNAQSPEIKTYLVGQISRAATLFNVNEIVVFSETVLENVEDEDQTLKLNKKQNGCVQMSRILQFLECPQYLRKYYFPIHKDLEYAGLLNPTNMPHHLRVEEESEYREGIVLNKPVKDGKGSFVYIGLQKSAIIDKILQPNVRVTVQLDKEQLSKKHFRGKAVAPSAPYKYGNTYWGYNVRLAKGLNSVFTECPYKSGYDLKIGTSDKGQDIDTVEIPKFKHLLVVFGGLKGIESCLEGDESIEVTEASKLFDYYLNTCPDQGSRTIRTEEAILITMSALRPAIRQVQNVK